MEMSLPLVVFSVLSGLTSHYPSTSPTDVIYKGKSVLTDPEYW